MLESKRSCSKCYGMDCFATYVTNAQIDDNVRVAVPSATEWITSVHTSHMSKAVIITLVFRVLLGTCSIFAVSRFPRFPIFAFSCFRVFAFAFSRLRFLVLYHAQVQSSCFRVCMFSCYHRFSPPVFAFCRRHPRGRDTDCVCAEQGWTRFL